MMIIMHISLTDDMREFVESEAKQNGYASAEEYFQGLLVQERKRRTILELEAKLLKGLQGPMVVMDRAEWDSIREEARRGSPQEEIRP